MVLAMVAASTSVTAGPDCCSATTASGRATDFASRSATDLSICTGTDVAIAGAAEFSTTASHRACLTRTYCGAAQSAALAELLTAAANARVPAAAAIPEFLTSTAEVAIADTDAIVAVEAVTVTPASAAPAVI